MRFLILPLLLLGLLGSASLSAKEYALQRDDQELVVDIHFLVPGDRKKEVLSWVEFVADSLAGVYGRWPRDSWRVEVTPVSLYSKDPVPWAQVNRGDPDTVSLYIDAMASEEKLRKNWTAYHEFSHLLIPYRGWGDMWFSEGLASYYQNLLQARAGFLNETEMWQRLYEGFKRGQNNRRPDLSLAELSSQMRENRSYMRVYWSGAWYFLRADVELRRRTNSTQSLDTALALLNACCADRAMSARQMAARLDQLTGEELFLPLFEKVAASQDIPAFETLFAELSMRIENDQVILDAGPDGVSIREGICRGRGTG
jgi:hypothetical protein